MVSIAFTIQVLPEKRQELMQTLEAIMEKTSVMQDCVSCDLQQDPENLYVITLRMGWKSQEDCHSYQQSEHFGVLLGAFNLLCSSKEMQYDAVKE